MKTGEDEQSMLEAPPCVSGTPSAATKTSNVIFMIPDCVVAQRMVRPLPRNTKNGHYYRVVETSVTLGVAENEANQETYKGWKGHLVTITSTSESNFLKDLVGAQHWISGKLISNSFIWTSGPEAGMTISSGTGSCFASGFCRWRSTYPKLMAFQCPCLCITAETDGTWINRPCSWKRRYAIEYEPFIGKEKCLTGYRYIYHLGCVPNNPCDLQPCKSGQTCSIKNSEANLDPTLLNSSSGIEASATTLIASSVSSINTGNASSSMLYTSSSNSATNKLNNTTELPSSPISPDLQLYEPRSYFFSPDITKTDRESFVAFLLFALQKNRNDSYIAEVQDWMMVSLKDAIHIVQAERSLSGKAISTLTTASAYNNFHSTNVTNIMNETDDMNYNDDIQVSTPVELINATDFGRLAGIVFREKDSGNAIDQQAIQASINLAAFRVWGGLNTSQQNAFWYWMGQDGEPEDVSIVYDENHREQPSSFPTTQSGIILSPIVTTTEELGNGDGESSARRLANVHKDAWTGI
eukprot:gene8707-10311_t